MKYLFFHKTFFPLGGGKIVKDSQKFSGQLIWKLISKGINYFSSIDQTLPQLKKSSHLYFSIRSKIGRSKKPAKSTLVWVRYNKIMVRFLRTLGSRSRVIVASDSQKYSQTQNDPRTIPNAKLLLAKK